MPITIVDIPALGKRAQNLLKHTENIRIKIIIIWKEFKGMDLDVLRGLLVGTGKMNKATNDRLDSMIKQIAEGTFNPNRRFAKNKKWQEFKKEYQETFFKANNLLKKSKLREMMKTQDFKMEMFKKFVKRLERLENYKGLKTDEDVNTVKSISKAFGKGNKDKASTIRHINKLIVNKGYSNEEKQARIRQEIASVESGEKIEGMSMRESLRVAEGLAEFLEFMA